MANLFWKAKGKTTALLDTPFVTEDEFENTVFNTSELLEDIFLLKRQVRGGGKSGIPDIIGVDKDGNICIIEMKNAPVDASIVPQVLEYAFWAEKNPDSIKTLWLECEDKPEGIDMAWDKLQVRIIIIAPTILRSTLDIVGRIRYEVDLVEIKRWVEGGHHFLLVNKIEEEVGKAKASPVSGQPVYDKKFYNSQYNNKSVTEFMKYTVALDAYVRKHGWPLEMKYNKHYCGFKAGFFNAFGIKWIGTKTFAFFLKLTKKEASKFKIPMSKYESLWSEAIYNIEPGRTKISTYAKLFEATYQKRAGE